MNYGNDDAYIYFKHAVDNAAVFKANRFIGIRPLSTTTSTVHFLAQTHDNDADDVVTITHVANKFAEVAKTICAALDHAGANRQSFTVARDDTTLETMDAGKNTPLHTTALMTGVSITFDA